MAKTLSLQYGQRAIPLIDPRLQSWPHTEPGARKLYSQVCVVIGNLHCLSLEEELEILRLLRPIEDYYFCFTQVHCQFP